MLFFFGLKGTRVGSANFIHPSSVLFFLSQNLQRNHIKRYSQTLCHIQLFSSQLYEIIVDYLLILAKVTPKQCLGAILISHSKMQSTSCVSVKCEPNNFRDASCDSGNLQVVSYNSTCL